MSDQRHEIEDILDDVDEGVDAEERSGLVLVSEVLPLDLPILALRPRPFFPGIPVPMLVGGPQLATVQQALDSPAKALGGAAARKTLESCAQTRDESRGGEERSQIDSGADGLPRGCLS